MSRYFRAKISENSPLNKNHNLLVLKPVSKTKKPLPGQFYMMETGNFSDPLLKRPFSIFRQTSDKLHFIYRIKGKGTRLMKQLQKGDTINILGPLGNSYPQPDKKSFPLIIIGGVGVASLFPLIEELPKNSFIFYGGRKKEKLLMLKEIKKITRNLIVSTDDGSAGCKGTVVDALNLFLTKNSKLETRNLILYSCGPAAMLKAVSTVAEKKGIKGYISMEENMACGVGACLGCTVKTKSGYKRVCKEGPVFSIEEIAW